MEHEIRIPRTHSHRIVNLLAALSAEYPELTAALLRVARESQHGLSIVLRTFEPPHTDAQRNYYRKWVGEFGRFCGDTPNEAHENILCEAYGSERVETKTGLKVRPLKRSANLSVDEYGHLIDTLIRVAAELDFVVPPPIRDADSDPTNP